jgi:hypothetical protein
MRMLVSRIGCLVTFLWVAAVTGLHAQQTPPPSTVLTPVPRVLWFSGAFRPADHLPVAPVETVTVAVYRDRDGGDALWRETQTVTMEADGRYSLLMGSTVTDGLPLECFTTRPGCWGNSRASTTRRTNIGSTTLPRAARSIS